MIGNGQTKYPSASYKTSSLWSSGQKGHYQTLDAREATENEPQLEKAFKRTYDTKSIN